MALVPQRKCDVYGTTRNVAPVRVTLESQNKLGEWHSWFVAEKDMCPRAGKRLFGFVERGLKPLGATEVDEDKASDLESAAAAAREDAGPASAATVTPEQLASVAP